MPITCRAEIRLGMDVFSRDRRKTSQCFILRLKRIRALFRETLAGRVDS